MEGGKKIKNLRNNGKDITYRKVCSLLRIKATESGVGKG